jgi:hypothetical protein
MAEPGSGKIGNRLAEETGGIGEAGNCELGEIKEK